MSEAHPGGVKTVLTYDVLGRLATRTEPGVKNEVSGVTHTRRTTYVYDADGAGLRETVSDLTSGDAERATVYTYDDHGRVETITDPEGGVVRQSWNVIGRPATVTDARGAVVEHAYSERGELITQTLKGWTGSPVDPQPATDKVLASFGYDAAGRLATQSDAMGRKISFDYFGDNLLAKKIADNVKLNGSDAARDVELENHTYDAAGNQIKLVTGGEEESTTEHDHFRVRQARPPGARHRPRPYGAAGRNVGDGVRHGRGEARCGRPDRGAYRGDLRRPRPADHRHADRAQAVHGVLHHHHGVRRRGQAGQAGRPGRQGHVLRGERGR
ncbi:RHS repeat domain-containing protein [Nonomuraea deserti]|uniref:RHS repeat domain-containing protein n=1 Tax=Nonomuraea deserti TaxID=1848322 RepID=UPI0014046D47|nr:RHS repeat domain-containing protein [Nonomuraea deserti]